MFTVTSTRMMVCSYLDAKHWYELVYIAMNVTPCTMRSSRFELEVPNQLEVGLRRLGVRLQRVNVSARKNTLAYDLKYSGFVINVVCILFLAVRSVSFTRVG